MASQLTGMLSDANMARVVLRIRWTWGELVWMGELSLGVGELGREVRQFGLEFLRAKGLNISTSLCIGEREREDRIQVISLNLIVEAVGVVDTSICECSANTPSPHGGRIVISPNNIFFNHHQLHNYCPIKRANLLSLILLDAHHQLRRWRLQSYSFSCLRDYAVSIPLLLLMMMMLSRADEGYTETSRPHHTSYQLVIAWSSCRGSWLLVVWAFNLSYCRKALFL